MHIKRFEANDLQAALEQIRRELGADALILETRKAARGTGIEVLAARPHAGDSTEPVPSGVRRSAAINAYRRVPHADAPESAPATATPRRNATTRSSDAPPRSSDAAARIREVSANPLDASHLEEATRLIETLQAQIEAAGLSRTPPATTGPRAVGSELNRNSPGPSRETNEGGLAARLARVLSRVPRETNRALPPEARSEPSQAPPFDPVDREHPRLRGPEVTGARMLPLGGRDSEDLAHQTVLDDEEESELPGDVENPFEELPDPWRPSNSGQRGTGNAQPTQPRDGHAQRISPGAGIADPIQRRAGSAQNLTPHGESSQQRSREASDGEEHLRARLSYLGRLVRSEHFSAIPLPFRELYLDLVDAEVDANLVFQILSRMGDAPLPGRYAPAPPEEVLAMLSRMIRTGGVIRPQDPRRVVVLVGPTGVGKTTTVAKIAGHVGFHLQKRVALISTDRYRIFGAEHLASYAALMGVPFGTAANAKEMTELLEDRFAEEDVVLVDTSGRSPRDPAGIAEIQEILAASPELEIHLVLAANGRARDLAFALDRFSVLPIRNLLFTKLDETTRRGGVFTLALKARRPVSYLGTGQEVPDDLCEASADALLDGLFATEETRGNA